MTRPRLLVIATAAILAALSLPAQAAPPTAAAQYGAEWLRRLVTEDGSVPASNGSPDLGSTASVVLALAAAGVGEAEVRRAASYLQARIDDYVVDRVGADKAGALGKLALVARAAGLDPNGFGGTAPANRLLDRILGTQVSTGVDSGLFEDSGYRGLFTHSIATLGLATARTPTADQTAGAARAAGFLVAQQCDGGGWQNEPRPGLAGVFAPCAAGLLGPDTNTSGFAAQAVAAFDARTRVDPLDFFDAAQAADGGFGYFAGASTDADSTALAIQGVLASHGDPGGDRFTGTASAYDALLAFQIGCAGPAEDRGAFAYQPGEDGSLTPNGLATAEAVPAAAGATFPQFDPVFLKRTAPMVCEGPAAASSPPTQVRVDAEPTPATGPLAATGGGASSPAAALALLVLAGCTVAARRAGQPSEFA